MPPIKERSLRDLESSSLGRPLVNTHVSDECHRLWNVPLSHFRCEDIRLMLNQGFGIPHLVPFAIAILRDDPFIMCNFFPGDLLISLLRALHSHPEQSEVHIDQIHQVVLSSERTLQTDESVSLNVPKELVEEIARLVDVIKRKPGVN